MVLYNVIQCYYILHKSIFSLYCILHTIIRLSVYILSSPNDWLCAVACILLRLSWFPFLSVLQIISIVNLPDSAEIKFIYWCSVTEMHQVLYPIEDCSPSMLSSSRSKSSLSTVRYGAPTLDDSVCVISLLSSNIYTINHAIQSRPGSGLQGLYIVVSLHNDCLCLTIGPWVWSMDSLVKSGPFMS